MAQLQPGGTQQAELGFFQHSQRSTPKSHSGRQKEDRDPPPLTCICEMASSILKRVCRMQEQDDWETVTHCRSHRISSHMHDTCSTARGCHRRPSSPSCLLTRGGPGDSRSVPLHPSWARKVHAHTPLSAARGTFFTRSPARDASLSRRGTFLSWSRAVFSPHTQGKGCSGGAPRTVTPLEDTALTAVAAQISQRQDAQHRARGLPTLVNQRKSCMSRHE